MKAKSFKIGDSVRIEKIPSDLTDPAAIGTPGVFQRLLGKTFPIAGISDHGLLELEVTKKDTIWIEPKFVSRLKRKRNWHLDILINRSFNG
jgi:hypothetical protein